LPKHEDIALLIGITDAPVLILQNHSIRNHYKWQNPEQTNVQKYKLNITTQIKMHLYQLLQKSHIYKKFQLFMMLRSISPFNQSVIIRFLKCIILIIVYRAAVKIIFVVFILVLINTLIFLDL